MKIKLFTKTNCPKCPPAKALCEDLKEQCVIESYSIDERDGLAEASFYSVMSTPSIIIVKINDECEVKGFRGDVPKKEEVLAVLKNGN